KQQQTLTPILDDPTTSTSSSTSTPSSMVSDANKTAWAKENRKNLKRLGGGDRGDGGGRGGDDRGTRHYQIGPSFDQ
ncbi:unnamed protein product, partial [Didymodactylos carnosus]